MSTRGPGRPRGSGRSRGTGRPRGRPPLSGRPPIVQQPIVTTRGPGRPRGIRRPRGRPPLNRGTGPQHTPGSPSGSSTGSSGQPIVVVPSRRGRPPTRGNPSGPGLQRQGQFHLSQQGPLLYTPNTPNTEYTIIGQ